MRGPYPPKAEDATSSSLRHTGSLRQTAGQEKMDVWSRSAWRLLAYPTPFGGGVREERCCWHHHSRRASGRALLRRKAERGPWRYRRQALFRSLSRAPGASPVTFSRGWSAG